MYIFSTIAVEFAATLGAVVIADAWRMTRRRVTDALVGQRSADSRNIVKEENQNE